MNYKNLKIATVLFTYLRADHTKRVLDSLSENYEKPLKLFIFQDGLKNEKDREKWLEVNKIIQEYDFCPKEIIVSNENKGLARSITEGLKHVSNLYDAFIVLEDDCLTDKNFIGFMNGALKYYANKAEIYCVSGYSWPINIEEKSDIYFAHRTCSWGWATWSDRWKEFIPNKNVLSEINSNKEKSRVLARCGNDLPKMLQNNLEGKNDSWAVYWSLHVINKGGFCVFPKNTLIKNIGMDGSGIHCGVTSVYDVNINNLDKIEYNYSPTIAENKEVFRFFMDNSGGYTETNNDKSKPHIIVYGHGSYFFRNEKYFTDSFYIEGFLDKNKKGYYAGKRFIKFDELSQYKDCYILILLVDLVEGLKVAELLESGFNYNKNKILVLGKDNLYSINNMDI